MVPLYSSLYHSFFCREVVVKKETDRIVELRRNIELLQELKCEVSDTEKGLEYTNLINSLYHELMFLESNNMSRSSFEKKIRRMYGYLLIKKKNRKNGGNKDEKYKRR